MSLTKAYLALMGVLLLGYAFLDKGFAYLGYAPVYVGELVFAMGLFVLLLGGLSSAFLRSPITWAILAYCAWGALITLPDVGVTGLQALRNSVVWTYSAFALLVAGALLRLGSVERSLDWYGRWLPWFIVWAPVGFVFHGMYVGSFPLVPGSNVELIHLKSGDLAVHLAGAMAFLTERPTCAGSCRDCRPARGAGAGLSVRNALTGRPCSIDRVLPSLTHCSCVPQPL